MFEDSLVESNGRLRRQNHWTTAVSFTLQSALAGFVLLLSLLYTDALPVRALLSTVQAPPPAPAGSPIQTVRVLRQSSQSNPEVLVVPGEVPRSAVLTREIQASVDSSSAISIGVPAGIPGAAPSSIISDVLRGATPNVPRVVAQKVRVSSGIAQGLLIRQVKPQYPPLAQQARIQGTVVLQAVISKDGAVRDLHVVTGHPLLTQAAIEAVKQWLYRPYYLNGEPVAVDTQINVTFTLAEQ